ncbi:MAG TPA: hypothetical protein DEG17_02480 [Cyanobacteria bacterium UBA11149]|nr:hypothetical protein [Cyanobacteria bacterium UBA11367]HBE61019.1 hypothetical protein [Cyanobacteria bacterium UBA11366]HBK63820.1 hypothetical protein [Cyanobacteria bacterium UBA11166]HBR74285.1 hypothetical protein [Cyanobacteria bacterium UBA11159]HBS71072.1 hypothetical protein [Cyanobacteria bacterium UBA11153]HBW87773.1 hypothetical protein [Cyanobacteria bacterium UBA11149]HCA93210.1 hypothetical protein [Cyanobacteria bacterium UBA9226]
MSPRSYWVRPDCIEQVKSTYQRCYLRYEHLAKAAGVSPDTIRKFLNGQPVSRENFRNISARLKLEWEAIANLDIQNTNTSPPPVPTVSPPSVEPLQVKSLQSQPDPNFVGRETAIADLNTLIEQGKKAILIQAEGGVGKTTLAWRYLKTQSFDLVLPLYMAKERQNITSVESAIEEWLKRYFDEEPGREFGISLDRLRQKLTDDSQKIGILIDNLEPALENGKFISEHRQYAEFLRMLTHPAVQSVTLITSRELLHEEGIFIDFYPLKELSAVAWNESLKNCHINTGYDPLNNTSSLCKMHQAYGGNAEAMFILSGAIKTDCEGDLEAYWQENYEDLLIHPTLENLVKSQFDKLQQDNQQAYQLLCRLGCYRYQDVPRVLKEGVFALLWDVPEVRRKRVVKDLEYRSLVKVCNQEYFLHPVIRSEAIERLRASEDWEKTNRQAAEFWTESVETVETEEDALKAFEAYYHYLNINDVDRAGCIVAYERLNSSGDYEALGRSLYIYGQLNKVLIAINQIINYIDNNYLHLLCSLLNILGDIYWLTGDIHESIKIHEKCHESAKQAMNLNQDIAESSNNNLKIKKHLLTFKRNAIFNIGLCYIDLFEYPKAWILFNELNSSLNNDLSCINKKNTHIPAHKLGLGSGLSFIRAFLNSYLKVDNSADDLTNQAYIYLKCRGERWTKGYGLLFLGLTYKNLSIIPKAFQMYNQAIAYAKESHYTQVKAKALTGLAELYRIQNEFETAFTHHQESINILEKIGAKCDLAEAYYQLGLTHQKIGETQNSQENFNKAIELYNKIDAPKQVEKVQRAMNSTG